MQLGIVWKFTPHIKEWQFESLINGHEGEEFGVWECAELFKLPVEDSPNETIWVLLICHGDQPGSLFGSKTQYFVGHFDGHSFTIDGSNQKVKWLGIKVEISQKGNSDRV